MMARHGGLIERLVFSRQWLRRLEIEGREVGTRGAVVGDNVVAQTVSNGDRDCDYVRYGR